MPTLWFLLRTEVEERGWKRWLTHRCDGYMQTWCSQSDAEDQCGEVVNVEDRSREGAGSQVHRLHQSITEGI